MRLLCCCLLALTVVACSSGPKGPPEKGEFDLSAIAADTTMQKAIETSYEYTKSLPLNRQLVYDVIAWGSPTAGDIAIVHRTNPTYGDTIAHWKREGMVKDCWLTDLDNNQQSEIFILFKSKNNTQAGDLQGLLVNGQQTQPVQVAPHPLFKNYQSADSVYYLPAGNQLWRQFSTTDNLVKWHYRLTGAKLTPVLP